MLSELSVEETVALLQELQGRALNIFVERRAEYGPESPTRIQAHVLNTLNKQGPISVTEVAQILQVSAPTASQLLNTLSERGWVTTETAPGDRRRHNVHITDIGKAVLELRQQNRLNRMRAVLSELTGDERALLVSLSERVTTLWQEVRNQELSQEGSVPYRYHGVQSKDPH